MSLQGAINNAPTLVHVVDWRETGDKPLPAPMMIQLNDSYKRHSVSTSHSHTMTCKVVVFNYTSQDMEIAFYVTPFFLD